MDLKGGAHDSHPAGSVMLYSIADASIAPTYKTMAKTMAKTAVVAQLPQSSEPRTSSSLPQVLCVALVKC